MAINCQFLCSKVHLPINFFIKKLLIQVLEFLKCLLIDISLFELTAQINYLAHSERRYS